MKKCKDHKGQEFRVKTFNKLLKDGYTIEQAIAEIKQQIADEIKERAKML